MKPDRQRIAGLLGAGTPDGGEAVWNKLQYDRDGIVEASAGTGKTTTLQRIVLKLVSDETRPVNVKNVLLVTFTEKAAGELKDRIRRILDETGCLSPDFAEATICTIHSFCRELLSSWAFENRVPMQFDIAGSDDDAIHRAVRAALLGDAFEEERGGTFAADMKTARLDSADALAAAAERFLAKCAAGGLAPDEPAAAVRERLAEAVAATRFDFDGLQPHGGDKEFPAARDAVLASLDGLRSTDYGTFFAAVNAVCDAVSMHGAKREPLNPRVKTENGYVRLFELRPDLQAFAVAVRTAALELPAPVVADLASLAWPEFRRLKDDSAALTFDDLVTQADRVVAREAAVEENGGRSPLLDAVRRRYRVALVDEFQDTDRRQWDVFRRIFSSKVNRLDDPAAPDPKQGFLLVVGDPKQAIYGWRGADVATYLAAKEAVSAGDGAQPALSLDWTWRSTPELTDGFNAIFGEASGWFEGMSEGGRSISYSPVRAPENNPKFANLRDFTGRPAVNLLESLPYRLPDIRSNRGNPGYGNTATCLPVFLEHAAAEMKRLRALSPAFATTGGDGKEVAGRFEYRDMCVLVRGHSAARTVQRVLASRGIPTAYYKEAGLFATEEADSLLALFDFLSSPGTPGNLAALLLTPLFGVRPADLGKTLSENGFSPLLDRWRELAGDRKWNGLFESVMDDTALARPDPADFGFDRRWAAFRQILDRLLEEKGRSALSAGDFAAVLRSWQADDARAGENGSLRQKESDGDRVQIMTMHASKGLEFKVVFVAAGWGELADVPNAEKRLYYVALTRAGHKLYLPWTKWDPHNRLDAPERGVGSVGSALLADGFLSMGIRALFGDRAAEATIAPASGAGAAGAAAAPGGGAAADTARPVPERYVLPWLKWRKVQWDSFTTMAGGGSSRKKSSADGKAPDERQDRSGGKGPTLLPRDNVSGTVFHEIMQELCGNGDGPGEPGFAVGRRPLSDALEDAALDGIVRAAMRRHAVANRERGGDSTAKTLVRMAWAALNAEIRVPGEKPFFLKDVAPADRRAEVEFAVDERAVFGGALPPLGGRPRVGAFNGSIDLLVRPEGPGGPVFVLDWKTNSLDGFGERAVAAEMEEARYDLQCKLYSLAVRRWLGEGAPAGVAWLFVRGGEGGDGGGVGVWARKPDRADCLDSVLRELPGGGKDR